MSDPTLQKFVDHGFYEFHSTEETRPECGLKLAKVNMKCMYCSVMVRGQNNLTTNFYRHTRKEHPSKNIDTRTNQCMYIMG